MATATEQLPPAGFGTVSVVHLPDKVTARLKPQPLGVSPEALGFAWHRVDDPVGATVRLTSSDTRYRVFRLTVTSTHARWAPKWVSWSFPTRKPRDLAGGDSVAAQDQLLDDGREVVILVSPGETRELTLSFILGLDGETEVGEIPYTVVIEDAFPTDPKKVESEIVRGILNVQHPPATLVDMLPTIYREAMTEMADETNDEQPPFFERMMMGFEDSWEPLRRTIDNLDRLFGAYSCPPKHLLWLGSWVSVPFDENWPEMRRRRLVKEAVELFRWRGTQRGLKRYIEIYTGVEPVIDDQPVEGWRLGAHAKLGSDQTVLGDVPPHSFVVTITVPDASSIKEAVIHDIIRTIKPAHTAYTLSIVERGGAS